MKSAAVYLQHIEGSVMPSIELTDQQVVDLVKQLPAKRRYEALLALADSAAAHRDLRMQFAESQLRRLASARGIEWDTMSEDKREAFIDELVHEDRSCGT
jgi:hypothetical protein